MEISCAPPNAAWIDEGRRWLAEADLVLEAVNACTPSFEWRVRRGGFAALAQLVAEQQVSVASAAAVWRRVEAGLGAVEPETVENAGEWGLKSFGLSGPKARYIVGMAEAARLGRIDFDAIRRMGDDDASQALQHLKGVGRWTAETYLLFCEGRRDLLPAADVALRHAVAMAGNMARKPTEEELRARAEAWRPYRGVAAHLLWRFYGGVRRGELQPPVQVTKMNEN